MKLVDVIFKLRMGMRYRVLFSNKIICEGVRELFKDVDPYQIFGDYSGYEVSSLDIDLDGYLCIYL